MSLDETHLSNDTPKSGEVMTESPEVQMNSVKTTPIFQAAEREVTPHSTDTPTETGEEPIQGNLTYL
jgi:hypothetical protein